MALKIRRGALPLQIGEIGGRQATLRGNIVGQGMLGGRWHNGERQIDLPRSSSSEIAKCGNLVRQQHIEVAERCTERIGYRTDQPAIAQGEMRADRSG